MIVIFPILPKYEPFLPPVPVGSITTIYTEANMYVCVYVDMFISAPPPTHTHTHTHLHAAWKKSYAIQVSVAVVSYECNVYRTLLIPFAYFIGGTGYDGSDVI